MTNEEFISECTKKHCGKYDYSKVKYINSYTKVCIICPIHGEFWMTPSNHLLNRGCPKCKGKGFTSEERKKIAEEVHDMKYDYSLSDFSKSKVKTNIICKIHGVFKMDFDHHVNGKNGCPMCNEKKKLTHKEFEEKASIKHKGKYTYHDDYVNAHEKVKITCPIHGDFYQTPNAHLNGQGCPLCKKNSKLEEEIEECLKENDIHYEKQVNCKTLLYLGHQSLDFFIPSRNIAIECQGKQHFGEGGWSKNYNFEKQIELDFKKYEICRQNGVKILYYAKKLPKNEYFSEIYTKKDKIINIIKKNK